MTVCIFGLSQLVLWVESAVHSLLATKGFSPGFMDFPSSTKNSNLIQGHRFAS